MQAPLVRLLFLMIRLTQLDGLLLPHAATHARRIDTRVHDD